MNQRTLFPGKKQIEPTKKDAPWVLDLSALVGFLERRYAWILGAAGFILLVEQIKEHLLADAVQQPNYFAFSGEVLAVLCALVLIGFLFRLSQQNLGEKTRALDILRLRHDFTRQVSAGQDIPDVTRTMVEQIERLVPSLDMELYVHEKTRDWFIKVNRQAAAPKEEPVSSMNAGPCRECVLEKNHSLHTLSACRRPQPDLRKRNGFCLPLVYGALPVGLLLAHRPDGSPIGPEQTDLLEHLSEEMAQALGLLVERKARDEARITEKIRTMQLDIARDLHDTVGQNISYLRMKLDHLSETGGGGQDLVMEIRSMSKVANESYDLMRGTLAVLQADESADLFYLLTRYAAQVTERSEVGITFTTQGTPRGLPADCMRHLFYIFREALNNVEKHAHASQVQVTIDWQPDGLSLEIADNGVGFDPARTQKVDVHYGLRFMRERAAMMNSTLGVKSTPGAGVTVSVLVPGV